MIAVYLIRCADHSLYTGMSVDLEKRVQQHLTKDKKAAKYTRSHGAVSLEMAWQVSDKPFACSLEAKIKRLNKKQKEHFILFPEQLKTYLGVEDEIIPLTYEQIIAINAKNN